MQILKIVIVSYLLLCVIVYFIQEKLIFFPEKLPPQFSFSFGQPFIEKNIAMPDGTNLHGLLFRSEKTRGLIFYLHGNGGSLRSWGAIAKTYTDLHYDIFMLDYRGYGKSSGTINSQDHLLQDVQRVYDTIKLDYPEEKIIVLGYSLGSGPAAWLASRNKPRLLILQAPYYIFTHLMKDKYFFLPVFLLKYPMPAYRFLQYCRMPITLFHGEADEVINYKNSLLLKSYCKNTDTLVSLPLQGHNGMSENSAYLEAIRKILGD